MSKRIKGIKIEIEASATGLEKALKDIDEKTKGVNKELRDLNGLLKFSPDSTVLLEQKQKLLGEQIENTRNKLNDLREAEAEVQKQFEAKKIDEKQYRDFQKSIVETESKLKHYEDQLRSLNNTTVQFGQKMQEVGGKMQAAGEKMTSVGKKLTLGVTTPIAAIGTVSFKAAAEFETGMAGVRKTTDMTADELDLMSQALRKMALEIPASTTELTSIAEAAGQLGIKKENIVDFTRVIADLGVATNIAGDEGATALAQFANITKMAQTDFDRMGSSIVELGNNTATTERDILNMSTRLAAAGVQANMSEADILGIAAGLASLGLEAQAGGSAFSKVINQIQLEVDTGGKKLNDFASIAGMSASAFSKAWKEDAASALSAFIVGLGDTERQGKSTNEMLSELGITELRMGDALRRTAGANELFTETLEMSNRAWEENNALTNEASILYGTTESKMQIAKNQLNDAAIELGAKLLPVVTDVVGMFSEWVGKFTELPDATQSTIIRLGLLVAALGPVLTVGGKLTTGISKVTTGLGKMIENADKSSGALSQLGPAAAGGIAAAGIGLVVGATALLISDLWTGTEATKALVDASKSAAKSFASTSAELETNAKYVKSLESRLKELSTQAYRTNVEQVEMESIIKELNKIFPELNLAIEEETGLLNQSEQALQRYINTSLKKIELEAIDERRKELIKEEIALQGKLASAYEILENSNPIWDQRKMRKAAQDALDLEKAIKANAEAMKYVSERQFELIGTTEDSARRTEWALGMIEYAYGKAGSASKESAEKQAEANKKILLSYTNAVDDVKTALQKQLLVNETYHDLMKEKVEDVYAAMGGFGNEAVKKTELTAAQLKENLENQIKDWNNWQKGLAEIQGRVPDVLFDELERMGVGALPLLEEFNSMTDDQLKEYAETVEEWAKTGTDSVQNEIGKIPNVSIESLKEAQRGMLDEADTMKSTGKTLGEKVVEGFEDGSSGSAAAGQNFADSFIGTLKSNELAAYRAGFSLGSAAERGQRAGLEISSPSKAAIRNAENFGGTFIDSILAMIKKASQAGEQFAGAVADATMLPNIIPFPSLASPAAVSASATGSIAAGSGYAAAAGGVTQHITINSPDPLTPSEVARQTKNASQQLAMEW